MVPGIQVTINLSLMLFLNRFICLVKFHSNYLNCNTDNVSNLFVNFKQQPAAFIRLLPQYYNRWIRPCHSLIKATGCCWKLRNKVAIFSNIMLKFIPLKFCVFIFTISACIILRLLKQKTMCIFNESNSKLYTILIFCLVCLVFALSCAHPPRPPISLIWDMVEE